MWGRAKAKATQKHYSDDPEIQEAMRRGAIRGGVLRTAIIWTPLFVLCLVLLLFFTVDLLLGGDQANWFLLTILTVFTLLFGLQSIHALLDLRSDPKEMEGRVTRRWSRTDSFVSRSHYVRIERQILRGDLFILDGIREGDRVSAEYYPRTGVLIALEKLVVAIDDEPGEAPDDASRKDEDEAPRTRRERADERRVEPPTFGREPREERRVEPPTWDR